MELLIVFSILVAVLSVVGFAHDVKRRVRDFDDPHKKQRLRR